MRKGLRLRGSEGFARRNPKVLWNESLEAKKEKKNVRNMVRPFGCQGAAPAAALDRRLRRDREKCKA